MIKRRIGFICIMALLWMCACSSNVAEPNARSQLDDSSSPLTWQEQYDLGVRYLSEGNYQEAIIAFTAAIEINPKEALAYVGRGDAYVGMGVASENLVAAKADYETAITLADDNIAAYAGLANVYLRMGQNEQARDILKLGIEKNGSEGLKAILDSIYVEDVDGNGRNPYGARAFTLRNEYIPFVDIPPEEQTFIEQAISAIIDDDRAALLSLTDQQENIWCYTIWNNYKIALYYSNNTIMNYEVGYSWNMEIRPQNGMGYYVEVWNSQVPDASKVTEDFYYEYNRTVLIESCQCVNWQWEGKLTSRETHEALEYFLPNNWLIREWKCEDFISGQMKNSLREGEWDFQTNTFINGTDKQEDSDAGSILGHYIVRFSGGKFIDLEIIDEPYSEPAFREDAASCYFTLRSGHYPSINSEDFWW